MRNVRNFISEFVEGAMRKCSHKVLVVDDCQLMHSLYDSMFADKELLHACDGLEALKLLHQHRDTRLIVLDVEMPNMDGLTMLSRVRLDPACTHIPVVLVSSRGTPQEVATGLKAGAAAYVTKPFRAAELMSLVDSLLVSAEPRAQ
jgi:CheY-like chemotaxis protein